MANSRQKTSSGLVLAVYVLTVSEGEEVMKISLLLANRNTKESPHDLARWLVTSPDVGKILYGVEKFYSVASGKYIGIYREWCVSPCTT